MTKPFSYTRDQRGSTWIQDVVTGAGIEVLDEEWADFMALVTELDGTVGLRQRMKAAQAAKEFVPDPRVYEADTLARDIAEGIARG